MPIYEYNCEKCRETFSVLQSINTKEGETKCPKCGNAKVKKMLSTFSCCSVGSGGPAFSPSGGMPGFGGG
ncbi:MAG: zinc ribbon domain-containing protein [Nitrospirae bacterium]|nr:MAG: zinc ribbon domain-containing protein [Nitrospirota bacterium]